MVAAWAARLACACVVLALCDGPLLASACTPLFGPVTDPCSGHGTCINSTTGYQCICDDGWSNQGDIFTIPNGADCVTNNTARTVMHAIGYVTSSTILIVVVLRMCQLHPFDLGTLVHGSKARRYIFQRRLCLIQSFQSICSLVYYCLVLFGRYYMHESLATTIIAIITCIAAFYKHTLVVASQLQAALSSLQSGVKGTTSLLSPLTIFLYVGATVQALAIIILYLCIWGLGDYVVKIALFRAILGFGILGQLWTAVVQVFFTTRLIDALQHHIDTAPADSDVDVLTEAITRLRPQRLTAAFVVPLFTIFHIFMLIFPMSHTYYMATIWIVASLGELSTLATLLPKGCSRVSDDSSLTPSGSTRSSKR